MHKKEEVRAERGFAVAVFVRGPKGKTVLVEDKQKKPSFPKLPSGKRDNGETPLECAVRELREETGLKVKESGFKLIGRVDKGNHDLYLFTADTKNFGGFMEKGNDGEVITTTFVDRIAEMDFFPPHKALLVKYDLIDVI